MAYWEDDDPELAEALRLSLLDRAGGSAPAPAPAPAAPAAPLGPNARVDGSGATILLPGFPRHARQRLMFEDGSVVAAGCWALEADGATVRLLPEGVPEGEGEGDGGSLSRLPAAGAAFKWCTKCGAAMDGRVRTVYVFRCVTCDLDLCPQCYNLRVCTHEFETLTSAGGRGGAPPPPPPPIGRR